MIKLLVIQPGVLFKLQFTCYENLSFPGLVDLQLVNSAGDPVMRFD